MLPFSEAAERNKAPLLAFLRELVDGRALRVLEIGSGTGQHAVHFAAGLPDVTWQTSDLPHNHAAIEAWLEAGGVANALSPVTLDADAFDWHEPVDLVFTANTFHIMHWPTVCRLIEGVGRALRPGGRLVVYGPFHVGGRATSDSNARFDASLQSSDPGKGVRGREDVCRRADAVALSLTGVRAMPANNQVLVFERRAS